MVLVSPSGWVASSMYFEMHYVRTLVVCTSGECATDAASYEALMQSKEEHEGDFKALNLVNAAALRRLVRESGALSGWVAFDRDFARAWQLHHTMGVSAAACAKK